MIANKVMRMLEYMASNLVSSQTLLPTPWIGKRQNLDWSDMSRRNQGRVQYDPYKTDKRTYSFLSRFGIGYGMWKCRQTGKIYILKIKDTDTLSAIGHSYFFGDNGHA